MNYPSPSKLWEMSPDDFNNWRRENDLKSLFDCFQKTLPHFDEWLTENNLTINIILETDNPGQFFYWNNDVYFTKTTKKDDISYYFIPVYNQRHDKRIQKIEPTSNEEYVEKRFKFTPYIAWVKKKHKIDKPINGKYSGQLETFRYVLGSAADVPESCVWYIAPGFPVLKLGGIKIAGFYMFRDRNLDFANLDFLEVDGKYSLASEQNIFYSHCTNILSINSEANFINFYQCAFRNLRVVNSRFYRTNFYRCDIFKAYFETSSISNLIIDDCSSNNFSFNRVEADNIDYVPPKKEYHQSIIGTYGTVADNYKRFRILYQSNGLRQEASISYYKERLYEMKYNWGTLGLINSFYDLWQVNHDYGLSSVKYNFQKLTKIILDIISYVLWGFGERPLRILSSSLFFLIAYSWIYYFSDHCKLNHNILNSCYFSVVTFTTLGYGDITPLDNDSYKLIVGSEALIGAFCMGLLVAGFANKSRY